MTRKIPAEQCAIIGANIRALRQRNGWTQARLGEQMGWPTTATPAGHIPAPPRQCTREKESAPMGTPPVAVLARTSTLALQDPMASLNRQIRSCQAWLPQGWYVAGYYWDVESGGLDLEARSQGHAWQSFAAVGIPRDGGMADLLTEAKAPSRASRRRLRRHRAIRPRHLQRAETGKSAIPRRDPAIRHRRARQH